MKWPTAWAECCRRWEVPIYVGWGRCGLCGQRPELVEEIPPEEWPDVA